MIRVPVCARVCLVCVPASPGSPPVSLAPVSHRVTVKRQRGAVGSRDTKKTQEAGSKHRGSAAALNQIYNSTPVPVHSGIPQIESR